MKSLTIRIDEHGALLGNDDGLTWKLTATTTTKLRSLIASDTSGPQLDLISAPAAASLAEARHVRPQLVKKPVAATAAVQGNELLLAPIARPLHRPLGSVLKNRRSERRFGPLNIADLATLLTAAGRVKSWAEEEDGYQMSFRRAPSAGARHPHELAVFVHRVRTLRPGLWHFDAARCALVFREPPSVRSELALQAVNAAVGLTTAAPVTIFAVAHMQRTLSRYPAGSTLVWRDAGALLGLLHLVASGIGLASCIAGTAGVLEFDRTQLVADFGAVVVGGRISSGSGQHQ